MTAVVAVAELRRRGCLVNTGGWFPFIGTEEKEICVDSMLAIICGPLGGIRLPLRESALNLPEPNYWVDKCDLLLKEGTDKHNLSELDREHASCGHKLGSYIPENSRFENEVAYRDAPSTAGTSSHI